MVGSVDNDFEYPKLIGQMRRYTIPYCESKGAFVQPKLKTLPVTYPADM